MHKSSNCNCNYNCKSSNCNCNCKSSNCNKCHNIRIREDSSSFNSIQPKFYLYGDCAILPENAEVVECFPQINNTQNRLCLVNGYENAIHGDPLSMPPRYSLYDPKTGTELYEIAEDLDGNKVICIKDECNFRKSLASANQISFRLYNCLINDRGRYWQLDRRDIRPSNRTKKRRVLVQNSGNATLLVEKPPCNNRSTEYERRRGHFLNKTRFICNQRPEVLRHA